MGWLCINLYNVGMLSAVLDHYPIDSVKAIGSEPFSIFKKPYIRVGGEILSLDTIEKSLLLEKYGDERVHFAVNCASASCPPLRAEPYRGARLDAQLDEQTRLFAESTRAVQVNADQRTIAYSELFNWYASDFGVNSPSESLNRYRSEALPVDHSESWISYDWSLNAASK